MTEEIKRQRPLKPSYRKENDPLLKEIPADWNETFKNLVRKDFEPSEQWKYFNWRADQLDKQAQELRQKAVEFKASGGKSTRSKANRYRLLMAKIAELEAELTESGCNLDELKASMAS